MFRSPTIQNIIIQTLLIGLAFTIRYTAIYYPAVSVVAILLSGYKLPVKIAGIIAPWLLIIPFIIYTEQKTKDVTGTAEFSVFGGWQIANNALYMYGHINVDSTRIPEGTLELDRATKKYFHEKPPTEEDLAELPGTFFMKMPDAILKPYMISRYGFENARGQFKAWGQVSPIYNKYGRYLIKEYPFSFARYYLWLNTKNYVFPHLEKFGNYNLQMNTVWDNVVYWFKLKNNQVYSLPVTRYQGLLFIFYKPFWAMLNFYFLLCVFNLLFAKKYKRFNRFSKISILLVTAFLLLNFGFSVFATPVVLRYQIVPMILLFSFSLYLSEQLFDKEVDKKHSKLST